MTAENIEKVVNAYFDNMAAMDAQAWIKDFAEDAVLYDPVGNPPNNPHESCQQFFGLLSNNFEKLELLRDNIFIAGNQAAVKWTMQVVSKRGKQAAAEGISVFEFNDEGKIQKVSAYWNDRALMAQLKG